MLLFKNINEQSFTIIMIQILFKGIVHHIIKFYSKPFWSQKEILWRMVQWKTLLWKKNSMEINGYRFATFHNKSFMVNRRIKKWHPIIQIRIYPALKSNKGTFTPQWYIKMFTLDWLSYTKRIFPKQTCL